MTKDKTNTGNSTEKPQVQIKILPDSYTTEAVNHLKTNFEKSVKSDLSLLKKHGILTPDN